MVKRRKNKPILKPVKIKYGKPYTRGKVTYTPYKRKPTRKQKKQSKEEFAYFQKLRAKGYDV